MSRIATGRRDMICVDRRRAIAALGGLCAQVAAQGQTATSTPAAVSRLVGSVGVPTFLQQPIQALGKRMNQAGKEQITQVGSLSSQQSTFAAVTVRQLPNLVRVELTGAKSKVLGFDGQDARVVGTLDDFDEDLTESLTEDTAEGLISEAAAGGACRMLVSGVRPDPKKFPGYTGPAFDIVELSLVSRSRSVKARQVKRYYFDSSTQLLARTVYGKSRAGQLTVHETRFGDWVSVDGDWIPQRVEKIAGGALLFLFSATRTTLAAAAADSVFAPGKA